jgi:hypothetical protein
VTIIEQIEKFWTDFLGFLSTLVIPDWGAVIGLLPLLMLIGIVGPILSIILLAWLGYGMTKPRTKVAYEEGARTAPLDYLGEPIFPAGEPYCPNDGLIYPFGAIRCDRDKTPLSLRCPKCGLVREASVEACGNCGLILSMEPRALIIATDRPPPGGAALA